jgi:hypothetical protein
VSAETPPERPQPEEAESATPEQPQPDAAETPTPAAEPANALSPHEVTDYLTGHEPSEEELLQRQHEAAWNALEDGSAVEQIATGQANFEADMELLKERNPGIDSDQAVESMRPLFDQVAAAYGPEAAALPEVLEQLYETVGGPERFAPRPYEERWGSVVSSLQGKDAFSR